MIKSDTQDKHFDVIYLCNINKLKFNNSIIFIQESNENLSLPLNFINFLIKLKLKKL